MYCLNMFEFHPICNQIYTHALHFVFLPLLPPPRKKLFSFLRERTATQLSTAGRVAALKVATIRGRR